MAGLCLRSGEALGISAVYVLDLAAPLAIFGAEMISQDREEPGGHVGSGLKRFQMRPYTQERLLHEIVGAVDITAQRDRKCPQIGDRGQHGSTHIIGSGHERSPIASLACRDGGAARRTDPVSPR